MSIVASMIDWAVWRPTANTPATFVYVRFYGLGSSRRALCRLFGEHGVGQHRGFARDHMFGF